MKLKHYFVILALCVVTLAAIALFATFQNVPVLFYVTECFALLLLIYLWLFYRQTVRPYDTLVSGMELVRDLDLTTRLAPSGQHEIDIIVRTFNDLLARLRSEHLTLEEQYTFLSQLIEASPMGIVQCDIDGRITTMNPAARAMLSPAVQAAMRSLPLGQEITVRQAGAPQLFRISHQSFPDRGYQHPFFLIETLTDEVRRAEKAAYERVIRMIAHEVNNSVAGMIGLESEAADRLSALSAFVTRFAEVVKIPQPQLQLCDLSEEVEACRPFLENLCVSAGVGIRFQLTDDALPVRLDPTLFQQVLINIVKNSVESIKDSPPALPVRERRAPYNPPVGDESSSESLPPPTGGPRGAAPPWGGEIVVACSLLDWTPLPREGQGVGCPSLPLGGGREGAFGGGSLGVGSATLTVTDNGRGIPADVASHLFTPFFSTKPQGQGLGLLLIRDILTAHHCTFSLLTDPTDHLTRFTIQFPA